MLLAVLAAAAIGPSGAAAQEQPAPRDPVARTAAEGAAARPADDGWEARDIARFLLGGGVGLGLHESGHLATDLLFDANPGVKRVSFGPVPFFALTHRSDLSPRREFIVSSAGFWTQQLGNEILLSRRPELRVEHAPLAKGVFAFNVLASVAYAAAAVAKAGPPERDTRGMAVFLGVDEGAVGAMLLAPAVLDTARYYHPRNRWLTWGSRAAKVGMVCLAARRGVR